MNEPFQDHMRAAQTAAKAGRWDVAEGSYRQALAITAESLEARRGVGEALVFLKRFAEAEVLWRDIVARDEGDAASQQMLGLTLLRRRDLDGATVHLTRALAFDSTRVEAAFNLGRINYSRGERAHAIAYFRRAVEVGPTHAKALAALVQTLSELQHEKEAVAAALKGLPVLEGSGAAPTVLNEVRHHLAHAYRRLGDIAAAADCYRAMVAADPTDAVAQHLLAASEGKVNAGSASGFAKAFFDNLAGTFDEHLVGRLGYGSPARLLADLGALRHDPASFASVLDLGCGTGLMARALAEKYTMPNLVGLDISEKMLQEAAKRGLYSALVAGDLLTGMRARMDAFDLIIAADVFIYVPDLAPVMPEAARLLRPRGLFAFTVEISALADVELATNGHHRHNKDHLLRTAAASGLTLAHTADAPIRKEATEMVLGHYIYLEKTNRP